MPPKKAKSLEALQPTHFLYNPEPRVTRKTTMSLKEKDPAQTKGEDGGSGLQPQQPSSSNVPGWLYQPPPRVDDQSVIDAAIKNLGPLEVMQRGALTFSEISALIFLKTKRTLTTHQPFKLK